MDRKRSVSSSTTSSQNDRCHRRRRKLNKFVETKICSFHIKHAAYIAAVFDTMVTISFAAYGSYTLTLPKPHQSRNDVSPPWLALITIAYISVLFNLIMCVGIRTRYPSLLIGQLILQSARLAVLFIVFVMYVAWSARRHTIDNLNIPASKRPPVFWAVAVAVFAVVIVYQIFYFRIVTQVYSFLRLRHRTVMDMGKILIVDERRNGNMRRSRLLRNDSERVDDPDRPRISLVEELFPSYFSAFDSRKKSMMKLPDPLGSATERIGAYPVTAAHFYYKPPPPIEFRRLAVKRGSRRESSYMGPV